MKQGKLLLSIVGILFGTFLFIFGGYDDSPGGQMLGLILVVGGIVGIVKSAKKNSSSSSVNSRAIYDKK